MRILSILIASTCAFTAAAQRSFIAAPLSGANITPGQQLTVQIIRPNSLQGSTEVGIVIGLQSCVTHPDGQCAPPNQSVGSVLFNGDYNPQLHEQPGRPYQNFTVTIPTGFPSGGVQLASARFHLVGVSTSTMIFSR
ncbi:hypothetical protein B0H34DRAFT_656469 [Crassisporium funariophilum]|nr:hypothetical protein B0H34DRAFT_656469 [Crassisporium funariophilum]